MTGVAGSARPTCAHSRHDRCTPPVSPLGRPIPQGATDMADANTTTGTNTSQGQSQALPGQSPRQGEQSAQPGQQSPPGQPQIQREPRPPFPKQHQSNPEVGLESKLNPRPHYQAPQYKAAGK